MTQACYGWSMSTEAARRSREKIEKCKADFDMGLSI